jgi:tetraacyldisaccharide 4'-kinase
MVNPTWFRELVSGRRRGVGATMLRGLLWLAEAPYAAAASWRNARYDTGRAEVLRVRVPVVSVGNLTMGGTGKTPLVRWIAQWLVERGVRVVIVSRGYRAEGDGPNDEARELAQSLPDVPHVQNPDRVAGACEAIDQFGGQVVLLDDGFQHRRLGRDLDIVLLDALEPFGFEHMVPRGTLREPVEGLRRAGVICLSRADLLDADQRNEIRQRVSLTAPAASWCELAHTPTGLLNSAGQSQPAAMLSGRRVAAFCGVGNPAGFRHTLASIGCNVVLWREFPDHHAYLDSDQMELTRAAAAENAEAIVCTHKDLVKLSREWNDWPVWAVLIEMSVLTGLDALEQALARAIKLEGRHQ